MKNERSIEETSGNPDAPTTLTAEQAGEVAGGLSLPAAVRVLGCPTCTSGALKAFANLAAVVNPSPEVQF